MERALTKFKVGAFIMLKRGENNACMPSLWDKV